MCAVCSAKKPMQAVYLQCWDTPATFNNQHFQLTNQAALTSVAIEQSLLGTTQDQNHELGLCYCATMAASAPTPSMLALGDGGGKNGLCCAAFLGTTNPLFSLSLIAADIFRSARVLPSAMQ